MGWSATREYAGGSPEHSAYGGGIDSDADSDSVSACAESRSSSWRLSRVPFILAIVFARGEARRGEAPKKSSTASEVVSLRARKAGRGPRLPVEKSSSLGKAVSN